MSEDLKCPICGEELQNKRSLALHMWNKHKVKYKEYIEGKSTMNESTKCSEGLIQPGMVKESKEFVNEKPAVIVDREIMKESETPDRDFVSQTRNPYRDLYPSDGQVMNEWLR